jgi:hypothetical protein
LHESYFLTNLNYGLAMILKIMLNTCCSTIINPVKINVSAYFVEKFFKILILTKPKSSGDS